MSLRRPLCLLPRCCPIPRPHPHFGFPGSSPLPPLRPAARPPQLAVPPTSCYHAQQRLCALIPLGLLAAINTTDLFLWLKMLLSILLLILL